MSMGMIIPCMEKTMLQPIFSNMGIIRSQAFYDLTEIYEKEDEK